MVSTFSLSFSKVMINGILQEREAILKSYKYSTNKKSHEYTSHQSNIEEKKFWIIII